MLEPTGSNVLVEKIVPDKKTEFLALDSRDTDIYTVIAFGPKIEADDLSVGDHVLIAGGHSIVVDDKDYKLVDRNQVLLRVK